MGKKCPLRKWTVGEGVILFCTKPGRNSCGCRCQGHQESVTAKILLRSFFLTVDRWQLGETGTTRQNVVTLHGALRYTDDTFITPIP